MSEIMTRHNDEWHFLYEKLKAENKELLNSFNNCEKLRATDWERLTKERDELKAERESLRRELIDETILCEEHREQAEKLAAALELTLKDKSHCARSSADWNSAKSLAQYQEFKKGKL